MSIERLRPARIKTGVRQLSESFQLRLRNIYLSVLALICAVGAVAVLRAVWRSRARNEPSVIAARKVCSPCARTFVLSVGDFGPPSMSYELIGNAWNQWKDEGHELPDDVEIKVIVYRGVELEEVKKQFPVLRGKSDYRYVEYGRAVQFLQKNMKEVEGYKAADEDANLIRIWGELSRTLGRAHTQIIDNLGD